MGTGSGRGSPGLWVPVNTVLNRPETWSWPYASQPCPPTPKTLTVRTSLPTAPAHRLKWGRSPKGMGSKGRVGHRALSHEGVPAFVPGNVAPSAYSTCMARGPSALFTCLAGHLLGC